MKPANTAEPACNQERTGRVRRRNDGSWLKHEAIIVTAPRRRSHARCALAQTPLGIEQFASRLAERHGWGGRVRTSEWRNQNPLPYHLATPQCGRVNSPFAALLQGGARKNYRAKTCTSCLRVTIDPAIEPPTTGNGVWLSLVEHYVRDVGVAGSNPATPTSCFPKMICHSTPSQR